MRNILTKLVREECANLVSERCLGLTAHSEPFRREGDCLIMQGKSCSYFRDAVLPLAERRGRIDLVKEYARLDCEMPDLGKIRSKVRLCECGAAMLPKKRLCAKCAEKKRRESNRAAQSRKRELAGQHVSS